MRSGKFLGNDEKVTSRVNVAVRNGTMPPSKNSHTSFLAEFSAIVQLSVECRGLATQYTVSPLSVTATATNSLGSAGITSP